MHERGVLTSDVRPAVRASARSFPSQDKRNKKRGGGVMLGKVSSSREFVDCRGDL